MTADYAYLTQVMLSLCELQDKGKGPYTEISTLLSEYLDIQVQENIKSNFQIVLHALTVIPDGVNVSKEARLAISKAASVFVLYATSCSNNFALKGKRKTITAQDVLSALEDMEFDQFVDPLKECLAAYKKGQQGKKDQKKKEKEAANQSKDDASAEDDANDVVETIEDDDDEDSGEQDETGAPTATVTANGDGESVVEISDSSDD